MPGRDPRAMAATVAAVGVAGFLAALVGVTALDAPGETPRVAASSASAPPSAAVSAPTQPAAPSSQRAQVPAAGTPSAESGGDGGASLASAPTELLAYLVRCGEVRAVSERNGAEYRVPAPAGAACHDPAFWWTPDGRLAWKAPVDEATVDLFALALVGRDGTEHVLRVPNRHFLGPAAFAADGSVYSCTIAREPPKRPVIYRWPRGRGSAQVVAKGCFPSLSADGRLAYLAERPGDPDALRRVRIVERDGRTRTLLRVSGGIVGLAWTADGSRVVVAMVEDSRQAVLAIDAAGQTSTLLETEIGELSFVPAPVGSDVAIVQQVSARVTSGSRVYMTDAAANQQRWSESTHGETWVAWHPRGDAVLVADHEQWRVLDPVDGQLISSDPPLGDQPAWCCPTAGGLPAES